MTGRVNEVDEKPIAIYFSGDVSHVFVLELIVERDTSERVCV